MIPFQDLTPYGHLANELNAAYDRVFNSGRYIGGREVDTFEKEWASYCQANYAIGVGNGHDALALAVRFFTSPHQHVPIQAFVPWKTCLPTWAAVSAGGAIPHPIQDMHHFITIAVHIYGQVTLPNDQPYWGLIEDCAQAHGASKDGIPAGKFGRVAAWSFFPTKNLGALGDAGAVTTDDEEIADFVRTMRNYGSRSTHGINSRLDPLQAAFLRVKLPYLDGWNRKRAENVHAYWDTIQYSSMIELPGWPIGDCPCWHQFAIEVDGRDDLRAFLHEHGVETMVHYPHVPYPPNYHVPEAEQWTRRTLSLPVAPHVAPDDCRFIGGLINQWMNSKKS